MLRKRFGFIAEMDSSGCIRQTKITHLFPDSLRIALKRSRSFRTIDKIKSHNERFPIYLQKKAVSVIRRVIDQSRVGENLQVSRKRRQDAAKYQHCCYKQKADRLDKTVLEPRFGTARDLIVAAVVRWDKHYCAISSNLQEPGEGGTGIPTSIRSTFFTSFFRLSMPS